MGAFRKTSSKNFTFKNLAFRSRSYGSPNSYTRKFPQLETMVGQSPDLKSLRSQGPYHIHNSVFANNFETSSATAKLWRMLLPYFPHSRSIFHAPLVSISHFWHYVMASQSQMPLRGAMYFLEPLCLISYVRSGSTDVS